MFSALKFIAASVIVALFGGFLLAGILTTQQGDEVIPAAVTESPSPMTTEELLSGMVTEEVEPGVYRVVNDGARELAVPVGGPGYSVEVGPDSSVWLSREVDGPEVFRLGDESAFDIPDDPTSLEPPIRVAPDGTLWVMTAFPDGQMGILSFDGEGWTSGRVRPNCWRSLSIGRDGTVWVTTYESDDCRDSEGGECPDTLLMRLEDDGSLTIIDGWADVHDGDISMWSSTVSPDGDVWLIGTGHTGARPEARCSCASMAVPGKSSRFPRGS